MQFHKERITASTPESEAGVLHAATNLIPPPLQCPVSQERQLAQNREGAQAARRVTWPVLAI
jgi:hypothetical protein